ncbi:MAG TPA: PrsW family intramembrane metalloprotease [Pilimelia sp.]|nr:PrsW family intramembrane metalloprotease [Pilimelia sp.]
MTVPARPPDAPEPVTARWPDAARPLRSRSARTAPVRPTPAVLGWDGSLLLPGFWMVSLLLVVGGVRIATLLRDGFAAYPVATSVALLLFGLYAVPFWLFVGALDFLEREPPVLLACAFAWGALVATTVSMSGSPAGHNLLAKLGSPELAANWGSAIAGATVEEIAKTLGIVAIALVARSQVNSVLDGVVYGALVGLGFQVVEGVVYSLSAVALAGRGDAVDPVVATFFLRGFLAGPWSHTLFSALAGAGVGYLVVRTDRSAPSRVGTAALALAGAWLCHFLWNSPLLGDGLGYGGLGVLAGLLAKGVPPLLMILWLVRVARAREADFYLGQLAALGDPRVVTDAELAVLGRAGLRAEARRYAHGRSGLRGGRAVRRLQRAQARLAVALSRVVPPGTDPRQLRAAVRSDADAGRWYREALAQRARLLRLRHPEALAPHQRRTTTRRWATGGLVTVAVFVVWLAIRALGGA